MSANFEIGKTTDGTYRFRLTEDSGKIILLSKTYIARKSAEEDIASVKTNARLDGRYERKMDIKGQSYFVLKSADNQVIGTSAMFASFADIEQGIHTVKKNAPAAAVVDLTALKAA